MKILIGMVMVVTGTAMLGAECRGSNKGFIALFIVIIGALII